MYSPELLLHVSRGVRWDSDHVVTMTDELQAIAQEIVRGSRRGKVHIGLISLMPVLIELQLGSSVLAMC